MAQALTLTTDARQTFRTVLGSQSVRVTLWWQPDDATWYVTLAFLDGQPIVTGRRLVSGGRVLQDLVTDFVGDLVTVGAGEPGREAWDGTHKVLYLAPEELP